MTRMTRLLAVMLVLGLSSSATAIITGVKGNKPTKDRNWPAGTLALANMKIRLGWWEGPPFGGGEYHFLYRGNTEKFADALNKFSRLQTPKRLLVIHEGTKDSFWLKDPKDPKAARIDWEFTVWTPQNWYRLYNAPKSHFMTDHPNFRRQLAAPRLDVWLSGSIDWSKINVPDGVTVVDRRLASVGLDASEGAVAQGVVYDMLSSKPVVNASLVVTARDDAKKQMVVRTNERGQFDIRRIPPGIYGLAVKADGYAARQLGYEEIGPKTLLVYDDVRLVKTGSLSGKVTDSFGKPLAGVRIRITQPISADGLGYPLSGSVEGTSGDDGTFTVEGAPLGHCQLRCSANGYYHESLFELHAVPAQDLQLQMTQTGMLRVRVFAASGQPVTGSHIVEINATDGRNWGGSAQVNEQGEKVFKGVPPGKYEVKAHPNPHRTTFRSPTKAIEIGKKKAVVVELKYPEDP